MATQPASSAQLPDISAPLRKASGREESQTQVAADRTARPHLAPLAAGRSTLEEGLGSSRKWRNGEVNDAWLDAECARAAADNATLEAELGVLSGQLSVTKDAAARIIKENEQLSRLLDQIPCHKDAFVLAPEDSLTANAHAISSIAAAQQAQREVAGPQQAPAQGAKPDDIRPAKRVCAAVQTRSRSTAEEDSEVPASEGAVSQDDVAKEAQAAAVAAAALAVNNGDPAKALVDLLKVYMQGQKRAARHQLAST